MSRLALKSIQLHVESEEEGWEPGHAPPSCAEVQNAYDLVLMPPTRLHYVVSAYSVSLHCHELGQCHSRPACILPSCLATPSKTPRGIQYSPLPSLRALNHPCQGTHRFILKRLNTHGSQLYNMLVDSFEYYPPNYALVCQSVCAIKMMMFLSWLPT